ncbi:hypothetical protein M2137_001387 [Parabacteroides sp. PFB2-10]|uniref:NVEALA domain-containing protein n=1 Tax=Parabacteroides sp. PFB2-10 TaxID=1742405 RepID=UPI002473299E|nr:NVEALA domain-containing protein [Parabacteroides sp. PFB2-10]MDH6312612.1 hypothetical protein [Parabacteroides sp. PFB2-10]
MKTKVKMIFLCICLMVGSYLLIKGDKSLPNELVLVNIEALAEEESIPKYFCRGIGTIDCYGNKVEFMIDNYSLK